MRRFLLMLFGLVLIVAGAFTLWLVFGPQSTEARTTGGVLYSQQEIAASGGGTQLDTVTDTTAGPAMIPMQAQFESAAQADLQSVDSGEAASMPQPLMASGGQTNVPLTTDITLNDSTAVEVAPLSSGAAAPTGEGQGGMLSTVAGYEQRVVELEWPQEFQVGRGGSVRIKLKMLEGGALQPVAEIADNAVVATPILITDRYDNYDAFVTATLSAPDFHIEDVTPAEQPLQRGGEAEWRWTLTASNSHTSIISIGLAITWRPHVGQPPGPTNVPIWGQTLQVETKYVFGLITVNQASYLGTALAVVGFVAQIPLADKFIEFFWNLLFGGRRRRRRRQQEEDRRNRRSRRY